MGLNSPFKYVKIFQSNEFKVSLILFGGRIILLPSVFELLAYIPQNIAGRGWLLPAEKKGRGYGRNIFGADHHSNRERKRL